MLGQLAVETTATETMPWWTIIVGLVGGLALFLYGIEKMSDGLRAVAGESLKNTLATLTSNRFTGVLTGMVVTAIIQSSSLTTVLVVGFISAGLMTLKQSIGVIFGANIGTTLTVQLIAFNVADSAWGLIAIGFAAFLFGRRDPARQVGSILVGLGLLFLAMQQMTAATSPLADYAPFLALMRGLENPILGILCGASITAVIQASAATNGMILALGAQGVLSLPAALALALGSNLGSCVTALLAAFGKPSQARQAAVVHLLFNGIGVLIWGPLLGVLGGFVETLSDDLPRQIAHAHSTFNIANTLLLIGFTGPIARLARWLVPSSAEDERQLSDGEPRYLDPILLETPTLALDRMKLELGHVGEVVVEMFDRGVAAVLTGSRDDLVEAASHDRHVNRLTMATLEYSRKLARHEMSTGETRQLEKNIGVANYLEIAGDVVATNLVTQGYRRLDHDLAISPGTMQLLQGLARYSSDALRRAVNAFVAGDTVLAQQVADDKKAFAYQAQGVLEQLRRRLVAEAPSRTRTFQMEVDLVAQLQRVHELSRRIAKLVLAEPPVAAEPLAVDLPAVDLPAEGPPATPPGSAESEASGQ